MDIMLVFDAIVIVFGIYMIASASGMKKKGVINEVILTKEEISKCKNKEGFIDYMSWRENAFGVIAVLLGISGIINKLLWKAGAWNIMEMAVFIGVFFWFDSGLREARRKFTK